MYLLIIALFYFSSTDREPEVATFQVKSAEACQEYAGQVQARQSARSEVQSVQTKCVAFDPSANKS